MLSVEWLFYHAAQRAGTGPEIGTTIPDMRLVLRELGQPEESAWPYRDLTPNPSTWGAPAAAMPMYRCCSEDCGRAPDIIGSVLEAGRVVVVALFVSPAFTATDRWVSMGSEIILPEGTEPVDRSRAHAVVVVGCGRFEDAPMLLLRNSWGRAWAANGHAWISQDCLERRLIGGFTVTKGEGDALQSDADGHFARMRMG